MPSPFFNLTDLSINFPAGFTFPAAYDTPESLTSLDSVYEEFTHHYATLGTSQGILMTLLRIASLALLSGSTIYKTKIQGVPVCIPVEPFIGGIRQQLKSPQRLSQTRGGVGGIVSYDVLCAAAMNLFDSLYAHIDTKSLTVPPLWAEKMRESSMRSTVVAGLVEMERPILQVFGGQGATDEVPLGYHAVMEGYARTMTDLAMWLRAKSKPNLVEEHVKNLALRAVQKENIPHYLTWDYVKARFQKSDPVTSEIAIAASYIALMHSNVVEVGEVPLFFRDAKGEHLWKAISQLSDMTHPGRTFLDACKAADTVLPQKKNDGIEILELTNRLCDEMGIPRPELMAAKLRCFLSNLRESMDPLYRSIIFMDALTDRGLRILELASKDLRLGILGQLDPEELSVVMLRNDRVFGDTSVQRFGLILFGSVLEQLFHRDRIVCYEKSRNNQNPFCPSSQECTPETFAPSKRCEGGFLAALDAIVGNYQNLRPPGKAPTPTS